jgi:hypothetical protein
LVISLLSLQRLNDVLPSLTHFCFHHSLRASGLCELQLPDLEFETATCTCGGQRTVQAVHEPSAVGRNVTVRGADICF